jgi:hypothetical protein
MTNAQSAGLGRSASTLSAGPTSTLEDEGGGGYLDGFEKPPPEEFAQYRDNTDEPIPSVDAQVLNGTGIQIEAPDGQGGWRAVQRWYPREHQAECTLDSLGQGTLRLVFVGRHALSFVGRLTNVTPAPTPQSLTLTAARHSRLGAVTSAVAGLGGATTTLAPGDTINLEFAASAVPEGKVRSYFLLSTGVYATASNVRAQQSPQEQALPTRFALAQNQPNPFARTTTIRFELPIAMPVRLEVFDLQGRRVRMLADRSFPPGYHAVEWDRRGASGSIVAAGVYLYRLTAGSFIEQKKMVLLRK